MALTQALQTVSSQNLMKTLRAESHRAKAYYALNPYPFYAFQDWKAEERGAVPKCRPYTKHITDQQARMLFGRPLLFDVEGDEAATKFCNEVWKTSQMVSKSLWLAKLGGQSGSVVLTWNYNKNARAPWQINVMDAFDEAIVTMDTDDIWKVNKLRVIRPVSVVDSPVLQIQITDWTDEKETIYKPLSPNVPMINSGSLAGQLDVWLANGGKLEIEKETANPFRIVPAWLIQNKSVGSLYGQGDLWTLWKHIDQLNLTADLGYKHNQTEVFPRTVYRDVDWGNNEKDKPKAPGDDIVVDSTKETAGEVKVLVSPTTVREHIREDLAEMIATLYESTGSVLVRPDEITNKGNLTPAVIEQLYHPLIQTTEDKRRLYGEDGICEFFRRMLRAATNINYGSFGDKEVAISWPPIIRMAEEDLSAMLSRQILMEDRGFTTHERAVETMASAEGIQDIAGLKKALGTVATTGKLPPDSKGEETNNATKTTQNN